MSTLYLQESVSRNYCHCHFEIWPSKCGLSHQNTTNISIISWYFDKDLRQEIKSRVIRYRQGFSFQTWHKGTLALVKEGYQEEEDVTFSLSRAVCLSLSICLCPESTDEEVDKLHCLNHSGSSATYSDYSPSQGSSGSSNPPGNAHSHTLSHTHPHAPALPAPSKDQAPQTHWTNRYTHRYTHVGFMFHFITDRCPSLRLSIISSSLSISTPFNLLHLSFISSIYPIAPSFLSSLHLSVSLSSLCSLSQGHRDSLGCCRLLFRTLSSLLCFKGVQCRHWCYI